MNFKFWTWFTPKETTPVDPLIQALAYDRICPDCKGSTFTMGPKGGMSQNIKCTNPQCGAEFCVAPFEDAWIGPPMYVERTNRTPEMSKAIYGF
jgi:hypothetical protein